MGDDLKIRDPEDRKWIKLNKPCAVAYWCQRFDCTVDQLEAAVKAAGTNFADDVEVEIRRIKAQQLRPPRPRRIDSGRSR